MSHDSNIKDIVLLGMRNEVLQIDFMYVNDDEIECMMDFVHGIAWQELMSRTIVSMTEWSLRARSLFMNNSLSQIGHVIALTKKEVNNLKGCGFKTRQEIFDVFKFYGLSMPNWEPGFYYEKLNNRYKFEEDEIVSDGTNGNEV